MPNKYCNLAGTDKIKDTYTDINDGFAGVEADLVATNALILLEKQGEAFVLKNGSAAGRTLGYKAVDLGQAGLETQGALGSGSFHCGVGNIASGAFSFAGGNGTKATASYAFSHGLGGEATANGAVALGYYTLAIGLYQTAIGMCNIADADAAFIIGNGANTGARSNAFLVKKTGDVHLPMPGTAVVLTTPDGTKQYKVTIDNSGNLTTSLVT